jgi:hypothetical protein
MADTPSPPSGRSSADDAAAEPELPGARPNARPHPGGDHQIIGLLSLFTSAILVVVAAVWALTVVGGWWMLALVVIVHLTASAVVLAEVAAVMSDQSLTMAVIDRIGSARRSRRKQPVTR